MPTIRNVAPWGDLDVPLLRRVVAAGEAVEVTDDQAWRLLPQEIWEPVGEQAEAIQADIDRQAAESIAVEEQDGGPAAAEEGVTDDAAE